MRRSFTALSALAAASLLATSALADQIYKWVDDTGRVNYGSKPPEGLKPGQVRKVEPKVSTIPFDRPDPAEVRAMEQRQQRNREQIERDADRDAAMSSQRPYADEAMRAWRDRCYAERRVDCDGPAPSYLYGPGFGLAPVYGGAYRPPAVRPRPPIAWFPGNAPPGFRVGPGPFDVGGAYVPLPEQTPYTPMRSPGPIQPR